LWHDEEVSLLIVGSAQGNVSFFLYGAFPILRLSVPSLVRPHLEAKVLFMKNLSKMR
jgi:hypothetical protein